MKKPDEVRSYYPSDEVRIYYPLSYVRGTILDAKGQPVLTLAGKLHSSGLPFGEQFVRDLNHAYYLISGDELYKELKKLVEPGLRNA